MPASYSVRGLRASATSRARSPIDAARWRDDSTSTNASLRAARETIEWILESFTDVTRVVVVRDGRRPVAFSLFYEVGDTLYGYVVGQAYDARARESAAHFKTAFYELIEQAIRRGATQIDDGTEGYEVKVLRGYELQRLSGFFHFGESQSDDLAGLLRCLDDAQRARFDAYSRYRVFK